MSYVRVYKIRCGSTCSVEGLLFARALLSWISPMLSETRLRSRWTTEVAAEHRREGKGEMTRSGVAGFCLGFDMLSKTSHNQCYVWDMMETWENMRKNIFPWNILTKLWRIVGISDWNNWSISHKINSYLQPVTGYLLFGCYLDVKRLHKMVSFHYS